MVMKFIELIMQVIGIGLVIIAAGLWAGAGVHSRPKHRDEQTMIGGTIWSQIVIPIGLMISQVVEEKIDLYVEGYYLVSGILFLWITGVLLIVYEIKRYRRKKRRQEMREAVNRAISLASGHPSHESVKPRNRGGILGLFRRSSEFTNEGARYRYDTTYYVIGILCILAGALKLAEFVMFVILDTKLFTD